MKYLLFDLDGTLVNNRDGIVKSVYYALESLGIIEDEPEKLERFIGPPLINSFKDFYQLNDTGAKRAVEKYRERYSVKGVLECKLYDGIAELLDKLKADGYFLCVATSKPEKFTLQILENLGIKDKFDIIVGATLDSSMVEKPDIIKAILAKLPSGANEESLMIGDRRFDILGAKECNMRSVGVRWGFHEKNELENAGADYIVDTPQQLYELITSK